MRAALTWGAVLSLVASLGWTVADVARGASFRVNEVRIEDLTDYPLVEGTGGLAGESARRHVTPAMLRHLADIRDGEPIWQVDLNQAASGIRSYSWIKWVDVARQLPGTIIIRYEVRQPVMLVRRDGLYYVDSAGDVFRRARGDDLDYPILLGLETFDGGLDNPLVTRIVREAIAILDTIAASDELSLAEVSEIRFDRWNGYTLVLRNQNRLAFGFAAPTTCLERLARLRKAGVGVGGHRRIDLAMDEVAVVTPLRAPGTEAGKAVAP